MEFEAIEPPHRAFANRRYILEYPASLDAFVFGLTSITTDVVFPNACRKKNYHSFILNGLNDISVS
jgi:hypothetical protein